MVYQIFEIFILSDLLHETLLISSTSGAVITIVLCYLSIYLSIYLGISLNRPRTLKVFETASSVCMKLIGKFCWSFRYNQSYATIQYRNVSNLETYPFFSMREREGGKRKTGRGREISDTINLASCRRRSEYAVYITAKG